MLGKNLSKGSSQAEPRDGEAEWVQLHDDRYIRCKHYQASKYPALRALSNIFHNECLLGTIIKSPLPAKSNHHLTRSSYSNT